MATQNKSLVSGFRKFSKGLILAFVEELRKRDKVATGKLVNSYSFEVLDLISKLTLNFESEFYQKFIVSGRKPGRFAPVAKIRDFCVARNIPVSKAFAINYKIYKYGIKPNPFIDEVLQAKNIENTLSEIIKDKLPEDIQQDLEIFVEQLNKAG